MRLITIILFTCISFWGLSSHIIGGEMYYDCLGNDEYRITVKLYRDCNSTGADFDNIMKVGIFETTGGGSQQENISFPGSQNIPINFSNPCLSPPGDVCVEMAEYSKVVTLQPIAGGYDLVYQRCCRGPSIVNLDQPDQEGITLTTHIPGTEGDPCNSSPRFNEFPPLIICAGETLTFDHSATDPDGDQLEYSFTTPFTGGTVADPAPNPSPPPFTPVAWGGGFNANNPLGTGSISNINSSGQLEVNPQSTGIYTVAVEVEEFRNGNLIGVTKRDFQFLVVNCVFEAEVEVTPQVDLPEFESFCDGLTVSFDQTSINAQSFSWDFGDPNTTSDVSTSPNPTYTYNQEGTYDVTLIMNPGLPCSDTSVETFTVREDMNLTLSKVGEDCITDNIFDFNVSGDFDIPTSSYLWTFEDATTVNSTVKNPQDIIFLDTGYNEVKIYVQDDFCEDSIRDSVFIYAEPQIGFTIADELRCTPYPAHFIDTSFAHTPIYYEWDFGDGNTSTDQNPVNIYENPGLYDVSLQIYTTAGCIDTLTQTKADLIEVHPSPTADFSVTPMETDVFFPWMTFKNEATNIVDYTFYFAGSDSAKVSPYEYAYQDTGFLYPMQVVWNQFGCPDTTYRQVYIEPITTYYAPNAFTPDGNGRNDVFMPIVKDVYDYEFTIYNRYGEPFFQTNDQNVGWDGTMKGKPAPQGVYVYTLYFKDMDYYPKFFKGHFTLIR